MSISIAGANTFQVGGSTTSYQVSPNGTIALFGYNEGGDAVSQAIRGLLDQSYSNLLESAYSSKVKGAIDAERELRSVLSSQQAMNTAFPSTTLGGQMKMIARLIQARAALGMRRQIFFCQSY